MGPPRASFVRKPTKPVYAVIRLDHFLSDLNLPMENMVTVKEIMRTQKEAEVERLNTLNAKKDCKYFWQQTRFVLDGKAEV